MAKWITILVMLAAAFSLSQADHNTTNMYLPSPKTQDQATTHSGHHEIDSTTQASTKAEASSTSSPSKTAEIAATTTPSSPKEVIIATTQSSSPAESICKNAECVKAAELILSKIDDSVKPCDDFYNFACGKYIRDTKIPEDKTVVDTFSVVRDLLQDQLNTVITAPIDENDIEPFKMVKRLYSACMNKDLIEKRGLKAMNDILDSMGGWPAVKGDSWDEKEWTWQKSAVNSHKNGYSTDYIVDFSVGIDLKNTSTRIVDIDQPNLGLNQVFILKGLEHPVVSAYHKFQVDLAILYGADRERAEREMKEAFDFEFALANISLPAEKRRNASAIYQPMTVKQVQQKYPYTDWLQYVNDILPEVSKVSEDETIIVYDVLFFEQLDSLLRATPKRAMANYVMWRVAAESTNFLNDKLRKRQLEYATAIIGQQTEEPRWKECIDLTSSNFQIASAALYVRKYFAEESKAVALEMVNSIREEFEKILKTIPWMDDKTREAAILKAKNMVTHIGYPDELMDDKKLIEYYKDVVVDETKFLESVLSIKAFEADLGFRKLRKAVNKTDWETHSKAAIVNAAYSSIENSIRFPAGILQDHFFSAARPKFMNYGAIGVIIGHEITHGFDDEGRQFDLVGNLVDWWEKETSDAYLSKAKCIIDQYANFTDPLTKLNLNGIKTQGENIADNGGAKEAYRAYQNYVKKYGAEPGLPGLNYSTNQLYWISSAQTWCAVFRPEAMKSRILTGVHSPNQFRVQGPFINMREFSNDFKCPEGSGMNPIEKCEVW